MRLSHPGLESRPAQSVDAQWRKSGCERKVRRTEAGSCLTYPFSHTGKYIELSLRAERSNLPYADQRDCFVASLLAMTHARDVSSPCNWTITV